jgi:hypothetical protein
MEGGTGDFFDLYHAIVLEKKMVTIKSCDRNLRKNLARECFAKN